MTFNEFMQSVLKSEKPTDQRFGQWVFNMLRDVRPELGGKLVDEELNGGNVDPFYDNRNLTAFWVWLKANW